MNQPMSNMRPPILWAPDPARIESANISRFRNVVNQRWNAGVDPAYSSLHQWSIENAPLFWRSIWEFCDVVGSPGTVDAIPSSGILGWSWFPEARINFAEALLRPHELNDEAVASQIAVIAINEQGETNRISRRELVHQVIAFAGYLRDHGIAAGDRVAAVIPNNVEACIAMLGVTAIGAIWSSCSPEFGEDAICDRFGQIAPKMIVTTRETTYGGKRVSPIEKVLRVLPRLTSVQTVSVDGDLRAEKLTYRDREVSIESWRDNAPEVQAQWRFDRFAFDHPICIVYSSGTTGIPKCIVHRAGGVVLQHLKEHQLHCDLKPRDSMYYYTTTGWMMWNWLVSALASRATVVAYDGSPVYPDAHSIWRHVDEVGVTHFGASPRYFATLAANDYRPKNHVPLENLRCVLSTGSPLSPESFDWIYDSIKVDVALASISGGTDILSCFVGGNPTMPVRQGEIQCKGLGMNVQVIDENGHRRINQPGELVCVNAFPSMPIGFWNDPDHAKYRAAYFEKYDNMWCHGDWAMETDEGSFVIFGRSDATLNPSGVRIGTAEIYQQVDAFPEVEESLATVLRVDGDEKIVLFVRMTTNCRCTPEFAQSICRRLRDRCSPRHVPAIIDEAPEFPRTMSGKLSEIAVRNAICGQDLGNAGALANPESLEYFRNWGESKRAN